MYYGKMVESLREPEMAEHMPEGSVPDFKRYSELLCSPGQITGISKATFISTDLPSATLTFRNLNWEAVVGDLHDDEAWTKNLNSDDEDGSSDDGQQVVSDEE